MTAKEYLKQYRQLSRDIESKKAQVERLREMAESVSHPTETVSSGGISDKIGRTVPKILDLEKELCCQVGQRLELQAEIENVIAKIDNPMLRKILTLRYIDGEEWQSIAAIMNYSVRHIQRLHGEALKKIKDVTQCH